MSILMNPWPWYMAGPLIALVMFLLLWFGKNFGMSSNFRTVCTLGGAAYFTDFFKINWKDQVWNLVFAIGALIGGFIASTYLTTDPSMDIAESTTNKLQQLGFTDIGAHYLPDRLFGPGVFSNIQSLLILLVGGILVGFGARYAGGCTSGHAISGLSNLQLPSLIAVIGFFIGGLAMVHIIMPFIF